MHSCHRMAWQLLGSGLLSLLLGSGCSLLFEAAGERNSSAVDAAVDPEADARNLDAGVSGPSLLWIRHLTGPESVEVNDIEVNQAGDVFIGGLFQENMKFDDSGVSLSGSSTSSIYVARIFADGSSDWLTSITASGYPSLTHLSFAGSRLIAAGVFSTSITSSVPVVSAGMSDIWWATLAVGTGNASQLQTAGGPNRDVPRGLAQVGNAVVLAADLGASASFMGETVSPLGGSDLFLGEQGTVFQYGTVSDEVVIGMEAKESAIVLLVTHDSALDVGGSSLSAPTNTGISVVQHQYPTSDTWATLVADVTSESSTSFQYNSQAMTLLLSGIVRGLSATVAGSVETINNVATGWAVTLGEDGAIDSRVIVSSEWTNSIASAVTNSGTLVFAAHIGGGSASVTINDNPSEALGPNMEGLVVFEIDLSSETVISTMFFPGEDVTPKRVQALNDGSVIVAGEFTEAMQVSADASLIPFSSGYPDAFVMRLRL